MGPESCSGRRFHQKCFGVLVAASIDAQSLIKAGFASMAKEYIEGRAGGYYVSGTRVSLDSIVQCFNDGLSPETILGEFQSLTLAQVYGAIAHYLENQAAIDAYRVRQEQRFAGMRRAAEPLPEGLHQRASRRRASSFAPGRLPIETALPS
jgi:uncharacterized protein (DUF433 family)